MLARLFDLIEEFKIVLIDKDMKYLLEQLCEPKIDLQVAYLADIFVHLNYLNSQLQGSGNVKLGGLANVFVFENKIREFFCKINLRIDQIQASKHSAFPTLRILQHEWCKS